MINYIDEIKQMNLWEKISQISSEVDAVFKDMQVGTGKSFAYKAVGVEQVITKVNDKMTKYGIVIYPVGQNIVFAGEEIIKSDGTISRNRVVNAEIEYEVVNIHKPEEKIRTFGFAQGLDAGDKASGKANTYCYKYVLLRLFNIAVLNEDPDKTHSNDLNKEMYSGNIKSNRAPSENQIKRLKGKAFGAGKGKNWDEAEKDIKATMKSKLNKSEYSELTIEEYERMCTYYDRIKEANDAKANQ